MLPSPQHKSWLHLCSGFSHANGHHYDKQTVLTWAQDCGHTLGHSGPQQRPHGGGAGSGGLRQCVAHGDRQSHPQQNKNNKLWVPGGPWSWHPGHKLYSIESCLIQTTQICISYTAVPSILGLPAKIQTQKVLVLAKVLQSFAKSQKYVWIFPDIF